MLLTGVICPSPSHGAPPLLAIIIDDLGNARSAGERTASLPGPVTCSVLPHTPLATELAKSCKKCLDEAEEIAPPAPLPVVLPLSRVSANLTQMAKLRKRAEAHSRLPPWPLPARSSRPSRRNGED